MMIHWCIRELLHCSVTRDLFLDIRNVESKCTIIILFALGMTLMLDLHLFRKTICLILYFLSSPPIQLTATI